MTLEQLVEAVEAVEKSTGTPQCIDNTFHAFGVLVAEYEIWRQTGSPPGPQREKLHEMAFRLEAAGCIWPRTR